MLIYEHHEVCELLKWIVVKPRTEQHVRFAVRHDVLTLTKVRLVFLWDLQLH